MHESPETDTPATTGWTRSTRLARHCTDLRERYVAVTEAAKERVRPVGESLGRAQLAFLRATDRLRDHARTVPERVRRLVDDPDERERLRRRLGGVGIALFTVLAIGTLAVVRPAGRADERNASDAGSSPTTAPATTPTTTPTTTPITRGATAAPATSPSTSVPGSTAPTVPSAPGRVPGGGRTSSSGASHTAGSGPTVGPATPAATPPSSARPGVSRPSATSTPTGSAPTSPSTVAGPPSTPAPVTTPPPTDRAPLLALDLVLDAGGVDGTVCLLGLDLLHGGACRP